MIVLSRMAHIHQQCAHRVRCSLRRVLGRVRAAGEHRHLVAIKAAESYLDGSAIYTKEANGRPLHEIVFESAGLTRRERLAIVTQLLDAVAHMHRLGIVYRDMKPDNVVYDRRCMSRRRHIPLFWTAATPLLFKPRPKCPHGAVLLASISLQLQDVANPDKMKELIEAWHWYVSAPAAEMHSAKEALQAEVSCPPIVTITKESLRAHFQEMGVQDDPLQRRYLPGVRYPDSLLRYFYPAHVIGQGGYGAVQLMVRKPRVPRQGGGRETGREGEEVDEMWYDCGDVVVVKLLSKAQYLNDTPYLIQRVNHTFLIGEFVLGKDLLRFLQDRLHLGVPIVMDEVITISFSVLSGTSHMHRLGLFHCDLKLENIGISTSLERRWSPDGFRVTVPAVTEAKLLDFGAIHVRTAPHVCIRLRCKLFLDEGGFSVVQPFCRRPDVPEQNRKWRNVDAFAVKILKKEPNEHSSELKHMMGRNTSTHDAKIDPSNMIPDESFGDFKWRAMQEYSAQRRAMASSTTHSFAMHPLADWSAVFIVNELILGQTLHEFFCTRVSLDVPIDMAETSIIIFGTISAIHHMHLTLDLYHRDLKLQNIMVAVRWEDKVRRGGQKVRCPVVAEVKILDFGGAKCDRLGMSPLAYGTFTLFPPGVREWRDRRGQWPQVDSHGIGTVLFDCLRLASLPPSPTCSASQYIAQTRCDLSRILALPFGYDVDDYPHMVTSVIQRRIDEEIDKVRRECIVWPEQNNQSEAFKVLLGVASLLLRADPALRSTPSQVCSIRT
ncbi:unnamed protein product [Vitrella brassicaformis CCMP3155]|uniref:Protein kinase domain-containing protein n=1 Tax=Vitrella brassicaformis (strain CCMP3155) TaxID=1169540 RepID=A0A0G4EQP7_VITBC|nr:unnamed protein product [Vitrella brassicaformis CCMP3155]|eukprot:CEL99760.1 unnamed protein product [Vitrella brassicaformis CCMP3155]